MHTIDIDFDVFKALTVKRASEDETYNDVLRNLLHLGPAAKLAPPSDSPLAPGEWVVKGVRFPSGTEFQAQYRGQLYSGRVERSALVVNGKSFDTPSKAAMSITKNSVNGWNFWECRLPGKASWQRMSMLRR